MCTDSPWRQKIIHSNGPVFFGFFIHANCGSLVYILRFQSKSDEFMKTSTRQNTLGFSMYILLLSSIAYYPVAFTLACENSRFSSLFAAGDVPRGGMCATQRQKFHTDDVNQCLRNTSGSHGVPRPNLFNFTFLSVDFTKVLCSSANELQQNSNASSREEYHPPILTVMLEIHRVDF